MSDDMTRRPVGSIECQRRLDEYVNELKLSKKAAAKLRSLISEAMLERAHNAEAACLPDAVVDHVSKLCEASAAIGYERAICDVEEETQRFGTRLMKSARDRHTGAMKELFRVRCSNMLEHSGITAAELEAKSKSDESRNPFASWANRASPLWARSLGVNDDVRYVFHPSNSDVSPFVCTPVEYAAIGYIHALVGLIVSDLGVAGAVIPDRLSADECRLSGDTIASAVGGGRLCIPMFTRFPAEFVAEWTGFLGRCDGFVCSLVDRSVLRSDESEHLAGISVNIITDK